MKYLKTIFFLLGLFSFLFPQWAMWSNPSLPVGNSSQGIGLFPGEVMMNIDMNYQHIIWSHDPLLYEDFVHEGFLNSFTINPKITIGLSERCNFTLSQAIGIREMIWTPSDSSIHHRNESHYDRHILLEEYLD